MIEVYNTELYPDGKSVNSVLRELQDRYHFLDNFEGYIMDNINRFDFEYKGKFPHGKFNNFLNKLFKEYIISRAHGIKYKKDGYIEFIHTGLLVTTSKVVFEENKEF